MEHLAVLGEAGAVARAVPAAVDRVPADQAAHVRADRGNRAHLAAAAVEPGGAAVDVDDIAFGRFLGRGVRLVGMATDEAANEAGGIACQLADAGQRVARGVETGGPRVVAAFAQVRQDQPRGSAVAEAPGVEAGGDQQRIALRARPADVGQAVARRIILVGPAVAAALAAEMLAREIRKLGEAALLGLGIAVGEGRPGQDQHRLAVAAAVGAKRALGLIDADVHARRRPLAPPPARHRSHACAAGCGRGTGRPGRAADGWP